MSSTHLACAPSKRESRAPTISKSTSTTVGPPDIVTFRLANELVYVPAAETYEEAVTHAFDAFSHVKKLRGVKREDISFAIHVKVHGATTCVRIGRNAWPTVLKSLVRYGLVDVIVAERDPSDSDPEIETRRSKGYGSTLDPPPGYSTSEKTRSVSTPDLRLQNGGDVASTSSRNGGGGFLRRLVLGRTV